MSNKAAVLAGVALALAPCHFAFAADDTSTPAPGASPPVPTFSELLGGWGLTANGYLAASYAHSNGYPSNIHQFDIQHDTFQLDQAGFSLAYQPKQGFGALVDLVAGEDVRILHAAEDGHDSSFDLQQAYIQYATGPLTVIGGKFLTLAGAEVMNPVQNTHFSRSLLFTLSEPIDHTGVRATVAVSDTLDLIAGVNNGWNVTSTSLGSKTGEAGLVWNPSKAFSLSTAAYFGKTEFLPGTMTVVNADRTLVDLVATCNATSALTLILNVDWNRQNHAFAGSGANATGYGIAAYVNYVLNDKWRVSLRGEYFNDQDGFQTSAPGGQHLAEATLTLGYMPSSYVELRLEGRYDRSQENFILRTSPSAAPGTEPVLADSLSQLALQGLFKF